MKQFIVLISLAALCACGGGVSQQSTTAANTSSTTASVTSEANVPPAPAFQFFYEVWHPNAAPRADVVIGALPTDVPAIHASGKKVLEYVTFYQEEMSTSQQFEDYAFKLDGAYVLNTFGSPNWYVTCPRSTKYRQHVLGAVHAALQSYDGLFVDNTFFEPAASRKCTAGHAHSDDTTGAQSYLELLRDVRQSYSGLLISNPGDPEWADQLAKDSSLSLWDLSDYVLWESYGYSSDADHDVWNAAIAESYRLQPRSRKILALSYVNNDQEARFAYAMAKIFGFEWTANLGSDGSVQHAAISELPKLGMPTSPVPPIGDTLHRSFEHAEVWVDVPSRTAKIDRR